MSDEVTPPPTLTLDEKQIAAVVQLRALVWQVSQQLRQGDPLRGALTEGLLVFQVSVPKELAP